MIDLKPWGELNCEEIKDADVAVMGVPFDGAVSCGKGSVLAPEKNQKSLKVSSCNDRRRF